MTDAITWAFVALAAVIGVPLAVWLRLSEMKRQGRDADTLTNLARPTLTELTGVDSWATGRGLPTPQLRDAAPYDQAQEYVR
jgi:hypothetical protein